MRSTLVLGAVLTVSALASAAAARPTVLAQAAATATARPAGSAAPAASAAPAGSAAPSASAGAAAAGSAAPAEAPATGPVGGYSYSDKPARGGVRRGRAAKAAPAGPTATMPGFETTADGGTRLFVQLTEQVPVEERRAQGSITYVLRGAHVRVRNNTNALVTVHFNTPVWRARLVPHGADLFFVVDLRANVAPTFKMTEGAGRTAVLTIDFPKGDYGGVEPPRGGADKARGKAKPEPAPAPAPEPGPTP